MPRDPNTDPFADRRRTLQAIGGLLVATQFAGCLGDDSESTTETPTQTEPTDDTTDDATDDATDDVTDDETDETNGESERSALSQLVADTTDFAFDLHRTLASTSPDENLLASPYSVSVALAMTYAGARGETAAQMRSALRFELDDEAVHPAFGELTKQLNSKAADRSNAETDADGDQNGDGDEDKDGDGDDPIEFTLTLANSVWGQTAYPWHDEYVELLESNYGAGMNEVDYASDADGARAEINEWVADRTEDRIDELLPPGSLDSLTRLVLTNAVYFAANWERPFPEGRTSDRPFTAIDGTTSTVPTMSIEDRFPYAEHEGAQLVALPYEGGEIAMTLVLPPEGEFEAFEARVDASWFSAARDAMGRSDGTVRLPKFGFESGFQLADALVELGMPIAFEDGEADFSGMADLEATGEELFVWDVYHDTFIHVDETGTEAAAATGVVGGVESAPVDPFEFDADRPFLVAICDRDTATLLFLGRVVDAAAAAPE
ncbi:MAG: serpin family protein [Halobacteriota archaeon]